MTGRRYLGTFVAMILGTTAQTVPAADHAVVFMYHHVDASTPASTSVTPEHFREEMDYLAREGFDVLPLTALVAALRSGQDVPPRSVALTFDDGYVSVGETVLPELARRGWPFTVFVSPEYVDRGYTGFMSWDMLRQIAENGGSIGNHSLSHQHLVRRVGAESDSEWAARVRADIVAAQTRLSAEVGDAAISAIAYPYGEYDAALADLIDDLGYIGFGQQSGPIGVNSDWLALPRFPVATGYDSPEEFALRSRTRPLDLEIEGPRQTLDTAPDRRPPMNATFPDGVARRDALACFVSGQGRVPIEWTEPDRFVVRPAMSLVPGRAKVNCTVPDAAEAGVYLWFSKLWMTRLPDGRWYSE